MSNQNLNTGKESLTSADKEFENNIRPAVIEEFSGQSQIIDNLRIFIKAAKLRNEALDHILFHGPPGLGKTTLSRIVANELEVNIKETSGPVIEKPGDLAGLLTNLEPNDVLFIDEIHRLSNVVEEYGLDEMDNRILSCIIEKFKGGPVGITTIATAVGEETGTLEEVYEPFLIQEGFLMRTPRGREVTPKAYKHLGKKPYGNAETPLLFSSI